MTRRNSTSGAGLIEGRGGERNLRTGLQLDAPCRGSAAQSWRKAWLARLYRDGIGTEGRSGEAAAWYIVAQRAGFRAADLNDMMDGLADDQIKQAFETANNLRIR